MKNVKSLKHIFFEQIPCVLRAICLNHERITDIALFERNRELFAHSCSFVKSDEIESDFLTVAHNKEQRERFAHGRSFLKSDKSDLLMVALFKDVKILRCTRRSRIHILVQHERYHVHIIVVLRTHAIRS